MQDARPDTLIHVKTFGPGGSYPNAVCGYRGGTKGRMRFANPRMIGRHPDACASCVEVVAGSVRTVE